MVTIRNSDISDCVIVYECCLALKKLLTFPVSPELSVSIITTFGRDIFGLLINFNIPEMI